MESKQKPRILIVDDSEMNRSILADILDDQYSILEAEDGREAVAILDEHSGELSLVLLDFVMPEMNGLEVLAVMSRRQWIENTPVIMISADNTPAYIERAYELGVTDFITRPFDSRIVRRRVVNTIMLYEKQKRLMEMVEEQVYERERQSAMMVDILGHIVEFRNQESGLHIVNVHLLTELLLKQLVARTDQYRLSKEDIALISTVSAFHDIGKIGIPIEILNKPGRLTDEEFQVMKTHSEIGGRMLEQLPAYQEEPLVKVAYQICRWHHERWDGRGYPDGLKGDEIPIAAQIVALADVYDALTSERVYKKAIPHETAVKMIMEGKCGTFQPLLLQCLGDIAGDLPETLKEAAGELQKNRYRKKVSGAYGAGETGEAAVSKRSVELLEKERMKNSFFASISKEIQFEYMSDARILKLTPWSAENLGVDEIIADPAKDSQLLRIMRDEDMKEVSQLARDTTPEKPDIQYDCVCLIKGKPRWMRFIARSMWKKEPAAYGGFIGKAVDIQEEKEQMEELQRKATQDMLTKLLNKYTAEERIKERLSHPVTDYRALLILDLDHFKRANDQRGHLFGDEVLQYLAARLKDSVRSRDIVARIGGDEFMVFLEYKYKEALERVLQRIFASLSGEYEGFGLSVSVGVAVVGQETADYRTMFHQADAALYQAKRCGRGRYCLYTPDIEQVLSP